MISNKKSILKRACVKENMIEIAVKKDLKEKTNQRNTVNQVDPEMNENIKVNGLHTENILLAKIQKNIKDKDQLVIVNHG